HERHRSLAPPPVPAARGARSACPIPPRSRHRPGPCPVRRGRDAGARPAGGRHPRRRRARARVRPARGRLVPGADLGAAGDAPVLRGQRLRGRDRAASPARTRGLRRGLPRRPRAPPAGARPGAAGRVRRGPDRPGRPRRAGGAAAGGGAALARTAVVPGRVPRRAGPVAEAAAPPRPRPVDLPVRTGGCGRARRPAARRHRDRGDRLCEPGLRLAGAPAGGLPARRRSAREAAPSGEGGGGDRVRRRARAHGPHRRLVPGSHRAPNPPTTALLLLGAAQTIALSLLRPHLISLARRPRIAAATGFVTARTMTFYLWNLSALLLLAGALLLLAVQGLLVLPEPSTAGWWVTRPLWLAASIALTAAAAWIAGPLERLSMPQPTRSVGHAAQAIGLGIAALGLVLATGATAVSLLGGSALLLLALRRARARAEGGGGGTPAPGDAYPAGVRSAWPCGRPDGSSCPPPCRVAPCSPPSPRPRSSSPAAPPAPPLRRSCWPRTVCPPARRAR